MMYKSNFKFVIFASALITLLLLSGCGLNQRSAASDPPVVAEPLQGGDAATTDGGDGQNADGGQQAVDQTNTDTATDQTQTDQAGGDQGAAEGGDQAGGEATDQQAGGEAGGEQAVDTPREDETQTTDQAAEQQPEPTPIPPEPTPVPTAAPVTTNGGKHTVTAGQTLFSIAQSYGLSIQELAAANGIVNTNVLAVGEELVIPAPGTVVIPETASVHIVRYGDTMFNIAQRYGLTVEALALHNNISNINRIDIGQEIKIPTN